MTGENHGSARRRVEQEANNACSTCTRFGCDEAVTNARSRGDAIVVTCEAGHVEETVFGSIGSDEGSASTPVDEPSTPDGVTRGAVDGKLDREDGYDRSRPDADEVGSEAYSQKKNRDIPVVDLSDY